MSEKSFAIFIICAALICGIFFYPEPARTITPPPATKPVLTTNLVKSAPPHPPLRNHVGPKVRKTMDRDAAALIAKAARISAVPRGVAN
jgi:hypothetical protein